MEPSIVLLDVEELTYREAPDALDVPIGTVMSRFNRGRRLMRLALVNEARAYGIATNGRNYAHLVYRGGGKMLSVFAESAMRGRLPLTHENPRKGFVTAGASTGGHQVFVVSDR